MVSVAWCRRYQRKENKMQQLPDTMACAARSAEVINKEETRKRERSKENKNKEENTDTGSDIDIGAREGISQSGSADFHQSGFCQHRRAHLSGLRDEDFFDPEYDAIDLAIAVTHGRTNDRRLWRKYLNTASIDEGTFRECVHMQWRENESDGYPKNAAACLTAKLKPHLNGNGKKTND